MSLRHPKRFRRPAEDASSLAASRAPRHWGTALLLLTALAGCGQSNSLELEWSDVPDRPWAGPHLWANRLQDWQVRDGRLVASRSLPMRTAHVLTRRLSPQSGGLTLTIVMGVQRSGEGRADPEAAEGLSAAGVLMGAGGSDLDHRRTALIHHSPGPGGGLFCGVDQEGHLLVVDLSDGLVILARSPETLGGTDSLELSIRVTPERSAEASSSLREGVTLALRARDLRSHGPDLSLDLPGIEPRRLTGGLALASHGVAGDDGQTWFSHVEMKGRGWEPHPERALGPILGAQYTVSRGLLTLTAQLFPTAPLTAGPGAPSADTLLLELQTEAGRWVQAASAPVILPGYTATFRQEEWTRPNAVPYRLTLLGDRPAMEKTAYHGVIRGAPEDADEVVVAAFTGNHNVASPGVDQGSFDWMRGVWFPHEDIVAHVQDQSPDLLFFSGDQVYEGASPTRADFEHPWEDYLYKWYLWLWAFRDLTRDLPSVTIPDDHDVFHGNVWGAGGRPTPPGLVGAEAQDQGGYRLPADWVNMVQRTQTSHLPPPWDSAPTDFGIDSYYTDLLYGGVSFAVLEDRKFKSPPKPLLPAADVWNGWAQNPRFDPRTEGDPPGAALLGGSQEAFLEEWAADWSGGTWMKVVLSQTIFANVATIPADAMNGSVIPSLPIPEPGAYVVGDKMAADMDSNGWPPSGRNRALHAMRKGFAVHLAGDQHLASTIQYGVDAFGDGPFALCVPSVANFWPRRWYPPEPGGNRAPDAPAYTGDFRDGFGNLMTVFAVSNPARWGREPATLHDRAPGYGIARFDRSTREVSLEAWPRWADPAAGDLPYPGWPVRFHQEQGYGKRPWGYLPAVAVEGLTDPVIQVIAEAGGEVVYTLRIQGTRFAPPVFQPGSYTLLVGEPGSAAQRSFLGLQAMPDSGRVLEMRFDPLK